MRICKFCLVLFGALVFAGCGQNSPSKDSIKAQVEKGLPAYLTVVDIKIDSQSDGKNSCIVKWTATLTSKETLYKKDSWITFPVPNGAGETKTKPLIKPIRQPGEKFHTYGKIHATRAGEEWGFKVLDADSADTFGYLRNGFDGTAIVKDSPEHQQILKDAQDVKDAEAKKNALLADLKMKDEEALQQKYAAAKGLLPEGLTIKGNLSQNSFGYTAATAMDVILTIKGIAGETFIVVISDSARPGVKQTFEGKLAAPKGMEAEGDLPSLHLTSLGEQRFESEKVPDFFTKKRVLILTPKPNGIDGLSDEVPPYTLTFRK